MSEGWMLACAGFGAAVLAAGAIRLCLRDVWDGLAAAALFIALYASAGGAIGRWVEDTIARELLPGASRGALVLLGAFAAILVSLVAVCAVLIAARRLLLRSRSRQRERA